MNRNIYFFIAVIFITFCAWVSYSWFDGLFKDDSINSKVEWLFSMFFLILTLLSTVWSSATERTYAPLFKISWAIFCFFALSGFSLLYVVFAVLSVISTIFLFKDVLLRQNNTSEHV